MAAKAGALYISNLPWTVGSKQLREYFSQFGHISKAAVLFNKNTGMSRGIGFVTFSIENSVSTVINMPNHILEGHTLNLRPVDKSQ